MDNNEAVKRTSNCEWDSEAGGYVAELLEGCEFAIAELNALQYKKCELLRIKQYPNGMATVLEKIVSKVRTGK